MKTNPLQDALKRYRTALLETAFADLACRVADLPLPDPRVAAAPAAAARKEVLLAARNVSAEQFTAEMMAAGFLVETVTA
jgi:hypothetical protein